MAKEILIDFFNCDTLVIDNLEALKKITKLIVEEINSKIVEETWHVFQPVGITYVAVIAKSHVTIHTWPEKKLLLLIFFRAKILFLTILSKESNPNFMQNLIKNKLSFAIFNNGEIQTSDAYNLDNFRLFNLL